MRILRYLRKKAPGIIHKTANFPDFLENNSTTYNYLIVLLHSVLIV